MALKNNSIDGEYDCPVNAPREHEDCLHNIIIPKESITSSKKKLAEDYIELPLSREYKKKYLESGECRPRIKIPEDIRDKKIIQVEIIPIKKWKNVQSQFLLMKKKWIRGI